VWVLPLKIEIIDSFGLFRSLPTKGANSNPKIKGLGRLWLFTRMRYLIRVDSMDDANHKLLATVRTVARSVGVEACNPKWTSYGALELDIFAASKADFETFHVAAQPLGTFEFVTDLNIAPPHLSLEQIFSEARGYFNSERYWEFHEVLERAWRITVGEEKNRIQGIILMCAAFVHHQKGEDEVALSVLRRALKQLDFKTASYYGIKVNSLRRHLSLIVSSAIFETFRI